MSADDDLLKPLRERIDALDEQLLALLNERAQCALEVGKIKEQTAGLAGSRRDGILSPRTGRSNPAQTHGAKSRAVV